MYLYLIQQAFACVVGDCVCGQSDPDCAAGADRSPARGETGGGQHIRQSP